MNKFSLILFFSLIGLCGFSQNQIKIDSLKICLSNANTDTSKIRTLRELAIIYQGINFIEAVNYSQQALDIAKEHGNKRVIANSYFLVANNLLFMGNYDEALKNHLEGLRIAEELNDESLLFQVYHNLGVLKDRLNQFDEALEYYFKALGILDKKDVSEEVKKFRSSYPSLYNNIGNIYESKKDYKTSKEYYLKAYNLALGNDNAVFGVVSNNLGKLEIVLENYDEAINYLNQSLEFRQKINDQHGIAKTYNVMALYYKNLKQYSKAIKLLEKSLIISQQTNALLISQNAVSLLSEIYEETKDYNKSLEYFKKYKDLSDSLLNTDKYSELTRVQLQYENELSNKENLLKQQRIRLRYIIISSSLLIGMVILSLLYFLNRSRNKRIKMEKLQLEKDMMVKNKELTTNVMYLLKKNELIDNITNRLLNLKSKLKEENKDSLQKIIFDLQSITDKEVWEEFEIRFQNVHEDFYRNLKQNFPDLTPSEIKLAAFLRLNMTTKDIASITGQSINAIEAARYRLRKKLGITNQEINLINFLLEI